METGGSPDFTPSQLRLHGEIQDSLDLISKEDGQMVAEEQQLVFPMTTLTFMCTTLMNMHAHTHMHLSTLAYT